MARKLKDKKICPWCKKPNTWFSGSICHNCYRSYIWERKKTKCKRCGRFRPMHAKGYCGGCYIFTFRLDYNKALNHKKNYNINIKTYKKITKQCIICGFNKVVDLHHLDENRKNNSETNLIGLCPNHHKMLHNFAFREEVLSQLKQKEIKVPVEIPIIFKKRVEANKENE